MNKKTVTLILSSAVFASFFFPLFEWHQFDLNGLNYMLSEHIPSFKYFLLLIPGSALVLFVDALNGDDHSPNKKVIARTPLLTLILIFIIRWVQGRSGNNFSSDENAFSTIDIGFWILLGFSLLLAIVKGKRKTWYQHDTESVGFESN